MIVSHDLSHANAEVIRTTIEVRHFDDFEDANLWRIFAANPEVIEVAVPSCARRLLERPVGVDHAERDRSLATESSIYAPISSAEQSWLVKMFSSPVWGDAGTNRPLLYRTAQ